MDVQRRLDRKEAAQFLTARGFRTAPATLAKLACVGGGPAFESFGRRPLYREAELLAWAQARSTGLRRSTSDPGAASALSAPATRPTESDIDEIVARALRAAGVTTKQSEECCNRLSGTVAGRPPTEARR
jgi:hypothetical protein